MADSIPKKRLSTYRNYVSRIPSFARSTDACLDANPDLLPEDEVFIHVFAPVICSYVIYVLKDAKQRGIKKLVFLARDGYLPYKAALKLGPVITPDIELSIISVSRYALRSAEYALDCVDCLETICLGALNLTFRKMMKRASLTDEEIEVVADKCEFSGRIDDYLARRDIAQIKSRLNKCPEFYRYVRSHSKDKLKITLDYLKQEGITKDRLNDTCIVDSGWIGTIQRSLGRLITRGEEKGLEGYYFGLYSVPKGASKDAYRSFYISPGSGLSNLLKKINFSICMFESICSSPESMTYGYEYSDGRVIPVITSEGNANKEFISRAEKYLNDYSQALASDIPDAGLSIGAMRSMCYKLLKLCMCNPVKEEAEAIGSFLFTDEVVESDLGRLASCWNKDDLKANRFFRKMLVKANLIKGNLPISAWPEGSIAISTSGNNEKICLMSEKLSKTVTEIRKTVIK